MRVRYFLVIFLLFPLITNAAISFDSVSQGTANSTSLTFSHTTTGTNRILFCGSYIDLASGTTNSITDNGTALTKISEQHTASTNNDISLWYLIAPATGTHDIVVTPSASAGIFAWCASYTGAAQTDQPDSYGTDNYTSGTRQNETVTTTVITDNSWLIGTARASGVGSTLSAGLGFVQRGTSDSQAGLFDSSSTVASGERSGTINGTNAGATWGAITASFAPFEEATGTITTSTQMYQEIFFQFATYFLILFIVFVVAFGIYKILK